MRPLLHRSAAAVAAYAGDAGGAAALEPAVGGLARALPAGRLYLLWPADVGAAWPAPSSARVVAYPSADVDWPALERGLAALSDLRADCAIVFTQTGWSGDVPAYIAYLAGIRRRAGIADEFCGGLLSDPVAEPRVSGERMRHLHLLARLGIDGGETCAA